MVDIRRAVEADVESGARCHVECWREAYSELVDPERLAGIVAEIAEQVELWQTLINTGRAPLVAVDGRCRSSGSPSPGRRRRPAPPLRFSCTRSTSGRRTTEPASGSGSSTGPSVIAACFLWVARDNPRAIAFYARNGFAPDGAEQQEPMFDIPIIRMVRPGNRVLSRRRTRQAQGAKMREFSYSSSSSSRASQVASRSTGTSNSGFRSTKVRNWSASHARVTSSSPRRDSSSSMPRSVKYTVEVDQAARHQQLSLLRLVHLAEPTEGAEDAGRVTGVSFQLRPGTAAASASGRLSAMNGQAPWLAGSSCTQRTSSTLSKRLSSSAISLAGSGYSRSTATMAVLPALPAGPRALTRSQRTLPGAEHHRRSPRSDPRWSGRPAPAATCPG